MWLSVCVCVRISTRFGAISRVRLASCRSGSAHPEEDWLRNSHAHTRTHTRGDIITTWNHSRRNVWCVFETLPTFPGTHAPRRSARFRESPVPTLARVSNNLKSIVFRRDTLDTMFWSSLWIREYVEYVELIACQKWMKKKIKTKTLQQPASVFSTEVSAILLASFQFRRHSKFDYIKTYLFNT